MAYGHPLLKLSLSKLGWLVEAVPPWWCDASYRYIALLSPQYKCSKTCHNPENGLSPENLEGFLCASPESSAILREMLNVLWQHLAVVPLSTLWSSSVCRDSSCAAQLPSAVRERTGQTSGSCLFSSSSPMHLLSDCFALKSFNNI